MVEDPFETLGMKPAMVMSGQQLETNYLRLSRELHPDLNPGGDQAVILARSAKLNDAYRVLRDPWRRARALIDMRDPQLFTMTKKLAPAFLMAAMELAEEIDAVSEQRATELRAICRSSINEYLEEITGLLEADDFANAAVKLHESRYYRKALEELEAE